MEGLSHPAFLIFGWSHTGWPTDGLSCSTDHRISMGLGMFRSLILIHITCKLRRGLGNAHYSLRHSTKVLTGHKALESLYSAQD